ncbi:MULTISPECIES: threonine export protein RhtC [Dyella]|uniref:Threonine export protein RhtC n=2 Tax=Dyella TaxID=231454 RepID=A0A4R0YKM0_9GAMM|nr:MULTISPECIES: threonine export protein RhtC [Dyella]TBR36951.1 threonine export protein RhtC [Dyella terrae]TCI07958.1 threonine export protein RhtC [Dyella soli]
MNLFLTIALVHLIALISPGPDFFFVSQTAVSRTRRQALFGVIGITLGMVVWSALALLGLQLLLHKLAWLERLITMAGGLYLTWMGLKMLRGAFKAPADGMPTQKVKIEQSDWATLRSGFLTNLANPKAVVYFGSVFSAFLSGSVTSSTRWGIWTLVVVETFVWFAIVAAFFALPAMRRGYLRLSRWIDGAAGAVFVAFGLHLVLGKKGV